MKNTTLYQSITNTIVAQLEAGTRPWQQPWAGASRPLRFNGTPYQGINVLILWGASAMNEFKSPYWLTFKQAKSYKGACVRKGAKSVARSTFFKTIDKTIEEGGEEKEKTFAVLRDYAVFNADQCDGLPDRFYPATTVTVTNNEARNIFAEAWFRSIGADTRYGGDRAFYATKLDYVQLPDREKFRSVADLYSTTAHEYGHWTGHKSRLDRINFRRWGDNNYAAEELVAELTASFVCADLGISAEPREDHAQYLASWLKVLKAEPRAIFEAAAAASKAAAYLHDAAGALDQKIAA